LKSPHKQSAEGAFQFSDQMKIVRKVKRAFSAGPFLTRFILGRCPRLPLNAAPLALNGFPNLSQRTFGAVDRIVIGDWQSGDHLIGFGPLPG
jgi:hypothetical protein